MDTALRVLILEDRGSDAELVAHALNGAGYAVDWQRVDSEAAFLASLANPPDLILADYTLPQFNALEAVRLVRAQGHDVPFIVVSGTIGEESAVECLKAGANDYLLKDRLGRLGHAVRRALDEHAQDERQRAAEFALRASEERNRLALQAAGMGTWEWDVIANVQSWSPETEALSGLAPGTFDGTSEAFRRTIQPDDWPAIALESRRMTMHVSSPPRARSRSMACRSRSTRSRATPSRC